MASAYMVDASAAYALNVQFHPTKDSLASLKIDVVAPVPK